MANNHTTKMDVNASAPGIAIILVWATISLGVAVCESIDDLADAVTRSCSQQTNQGQQ